MTTAGKKPTKAAAAAAAAESNQAPSTGAAADAPAAAPQSTAEQDTTTALATADAGQQQDGATDVAAAAPLVLSLGVSQPKNADALQELLQNAAFPLKLQVVNEMPRPVSFPDLQYLHLGHVAGKPETKTGIAVFRDVDQLNRFATDVQALCEFNGFKDGVQLSTL